MDADTAMRRAQTHLNNKNAEGVLTAAKEVDSAVTDDCSSVIDELETQVNRSSDRRDWLVIKQQVEILSWRVD